MRSIFYPFHAYTCGLDGRPRVASTMGLNKPFRRADRVLSRVRCEEWLGRVFVTLDPETAPVPGASPNWRR